MKTPRTFQDLEPIDREVARKMSARGYRHIAQVEVDGQPFGEPLCFKSCVEVGPFLRGFRSDQRAKLLWVVAIP